MESVTTPFNRRQFVHRLSLCLVAACLPGLTACQDLQPVPFVTGSTITPPLGCIELRLRDPRGDC